MTLISVDLPAPFSPNSTWISPCARSKLTPSSACTPGKRFEISMASRSLWALVWISLPEATGGPDAAGASVDASAPMSAPDARALLLDGEDWLEVGWSESEVQLDLRQGLLGDHVRNR